MANLRPDAGENGCTVRSPSQDPVIGQNFLFPVVLDRLWFTVSWYLKINRTSSVSWVLQVLTCPYHFTVCRKKWRPNISDMCKSRTWWICNQHLNIRAKCWIFVSVCFPLHIYVHFIYAASALLFFFYCIWWQCKTRASWNHLIMVVFHAVFNGNTVYSLDCSSSLIHALTILHAWAHPIRTFLFVRTGGPRFLLGRKGNKLKPKLVECS